MEPCEIFVNRRGINSIEAPSEINVHPGEDLILHLTNYGTALHIALSASNSQAYTDFYHENIYVGEETDYRIPVRSSAPSGSFVLTIIAGYGSRKENVTVEVEKKVIEEAETEEAVVLEDQRVATKSGALKERLFPVLSVIFFMFGLIVYVFWFYTRIDEYNYVAASALVLGTLFSWFWQR